MPRFQPDNQDLARRRGATANRVTAHNTRLLQSINRQAVQTSTGTIRWIITASDEISIRGLPAFMSGAAGAINGTRPDAIADRDA